MACLVEQFQCGIDYKGNDFELIPFGAGRSGCPGIQFAMAVNEIGLANLVHKFDWTLPGGARAEDFDMTESNGLTKRDSRKQNRPNYRDDVVEMHYLKAVIKETLHLPRVSTRDVEINGYNIESKTQVLVNVWQIGRDPKSYDKPEEFDPERRGCPGIQFGMAVNEIALAHLVHKFEWALPGAARA
ncbi:unnamed protein product [Prunus brigantina]